MQLWPSLGFKRNLKKEKLFWVTLRIITREKLVQKIMFFYKVSNSISSKYLSDIIPRTTRRYATRNAKNIPLVRVNNNHFMNTFCPSTIAEWDKLDLSILTHFRPMFPFYTPWKRQKTERFLVIRHKTKTWIQSPVVTTNLSIFFCMLLIHFVAAA